MLILLSLSRWQVFNIRARDILIYFKYLIEIWKKNQKAKVRHILQSDVLSPVLLFPSQLKCLPDNFINPKKLSIGWGAAKLG